MPTIQVNGARLYYEIYGQEHTGSAPILLIHGSTMTGQAEWAAVTPLLAQRYTVIVPDCRGHGQSENPRRSYAFREMAGDMAALIAALGYRRAHVIGHSNGGNVALVTLLEHPEVVQTCLVQAANAYVSADLLTREPHVFDPERVAREAPAWMEQMIALHGPLHGPDYWRDLLRLTLVETLTQPNYTPADLAHVARPTLVVQGEADPVNAPARHAQFMARHIPGAELWAPAGVGHNVHKDAPLDWLAHVFDFLRRRGDDANEALYRLGRGRYADDREAIFEVRAEPAAAGWRLAGQVLTEEQHAAALAALPGPPVADEVQALLPSAGWALVNRGVTDLRRSPGRQSERVSQALLGELLRVLAEDGDWARVRLETDGYMGWIQTGALHRCDESEARTYRAACDTLVTAPLAPAYDEYPPGGPHEGNAFPAGKLPLAARLPLVERRGGWLALRLPDGDVWWVAAADTLPAGCLQPDGAGIAAALGLVRRCAGTPYLWGGRSPFGYDCSGFAQAFLHLLGIAAPRDADQQYRAGQPVDGAPKPGDLLFFGETEDNEESAGRYARVTHVAISLGGDDFIHANGSAWRVSYNSFDPTSPLYRAWLRTHCLGARRF